MLVYARYPEARRKEASLHNAQSPSPQPRGFLFCFWWDCSFTLKKIGLAWHLESIPVDGAHLPALQGDLGVPPLEFFRSKSGPTCISATPLATLPNLPKTCISFDTGSSVCHSVPEYQVAA